MIAPLLTRLTEEDFELSIGFLHTPDVVRRALVQSPDVRNVAAALRNGQLTEEMVAEFVAAIVADYRPGHRLTNDLALAALAVVLELRPTQFAEDFLLDRARLRLAEMSTSINVARVCLGNRFATAKHDARTFIFPSRIQADARPMTVVGHASPIPRAATSATTRAAYYCEAL